MAECYLQNKMSTSQHLDKQENRNAAEAESGQQDKGSLSESNASGTHPQNKLVKVSHHCYLYLAVPKENHSDN